MKVSELMQTDVKTVPPEALVGDVIVTLADAHVSSVPVVDQHHHVLGVLSTTDLIEAEAEAQDEDARTVLTERNQARDLMTPNAVVVASDTDVREAARTMLYADVHRLYVVEHDKLVGVISTTDIVRAVATGRL